MMNKNPLKAQLGKGMAALLGGENLNQDDFKVSQSLKKETSNEGPLLIPVDKIITNKNQPRKIFKEKELNELASSIKENGIIQPITVVESGDGFEIIAGERRFRAAKLVGLEMIPAIIKRVTKKESMVMSIVENIQRADLNCVEEGLAYFHLMNEFKLTQEEVAKKVGKERSTIANFLRILKLPKEVIFFLQKEQLSFGHAKILASLEDDEAIKRIANQVIEKNLSVRELEEIVKSKKNILKDKPIEKNFVKEQYDLFKQKLEKKTGFHFKLKANNKGAGEISIKFSNEGEFNDIYNYLLK
jgi:ParB family chromosome partitioning protein